MSRWRKVLLLSPTIPLIVAGILGIGILALDLVEDTVAIGDSSYLKLTTGVVSAIALYLVFERWLTIARLDRVEAGVLPSDVIGLSNHAYQRLTKAVKNYVDLYSLWKLGKRNRSKVADAISSYMDDHFNTLEGLAQGVLSVPEAQTAYAHEILTSNFTKRFDAVSESDLGYWLGTESAEYHRITARCAKRGTVVNRIFLLSIPELCGRPQQIIEVLLKQQRAGIGWAIAIKEELDLPPMVARLPRDFALLDSGRVLTFFQELRGVRRRFEAVFTTSDRSSDVAAQVELYEELVGECWLVSSQFREHAPKLLSKEGKARAQYKAKRSNAEVAAAHGLVPDCGDGTINFLLLAKAEDEIQPKLEILVDVMNKLYVKRGQMLYSRTSETL